MAASNSSKLFRAGCSILGGLSDNVLGASRSSSQLTHMDFLSQQQRTFIQMRTNLKVVDISGAKRVMCIQALKGRK
ncbi:hypothetical protein CDL12_16707 [Handroanthus impetiginosus]|uniref:Uncharacterized protein n=1 Tax=Handroanthus impetiginosus TaxID=429701 RepID=A0A2G9GZG7_9LAMI|nr:hypothetical protein CDL12_16707 [Handroanthus impetiginosus]